MLKLLDRSKSLKSGFYVIQQDGNNDVIYISTNNQIYLYAPTMGVVIRSTKKFPDFIKEWRSHQFSLSPISDFNYLQELRESVKGIDRPGYNRLGMGLVRQNPKKRAKKKVTKKVAKRRSARKTKLKSVRKIPLGRSRR